jgi:di/tricarboxylate transporter
MLQCPRNGPATGRLMTGEILTVFTILLLTIALFMSDRLRLDLVALLSLLALTLTGIITPAEALAGFSDPVVVMIAALFVVGGGIFRTGVAERFGTALGRVAGESRPRLTMVVMLGAGALSGLMSSTGTVAVMLPVTVALAWNARISPSLLLIPLSVGALLGGLLTLIGTAPNIVVSNQLVVSGFEPFRFFDFTPVGIVMLLVGGLFMVLFGGRLLPSRAPADGPVAADGVTSVPGEELVRGYGIGTITRLRVEQDSPLVGTTPARVELRRRYGANVVGIRRRPAPGARMRRLPRTTEEVLRVGDEVDLQVASDGIERLQQEQRLASVGSSSEPEAQLAEVLLTPRSRLIGRTLAAVRFRERYRVNVLALLRQGEPITGQLADVQLRFADTLLVAGTPQRIDLLRGDVGDFVVVAQASERGRQAGLSLRGKAAITIMLGMMALLAFDVVPAVIAVLMAAVAMVLARCLDMEMAYRSINWESVVLIAAILPMATALEKTGGMQLMVAGLQPLGAAGPLAMLAVLFLLTSLLSQVISNTATTVLVAPVAIGAAAELAVSPYPLLMGVAVAASTAFATPIASPVTMLVLGPGAYRFGDFLRIGMVLQTVIFIVTLLLVPLLFPF